GGGGQGRKGSSQDRRESVRAEVRENQREVECQLQLVILPVKRGEPLQVVNPRLAEQQARRVVAFRYRAPVAVDAMDLRPVLVVHRPLSEPPAKGPVKLGCRVVPEEGVFVEAVRDVDAETGDAPVEPESQDPPELLVHSRLPPVQVGLSRQEVMQVVLAGSNVPLPGRLPGEVEPIVRRPGARRLVGPYIVIAHGVLPARRRINEPRVLAARMVRHEVKQYAHTALASRSDQGIEVFDGAELRMNAHVVAYVVTPVLVR